MAAGDELAHELVRRRAAAGHGQPVPLVQVIAGLDLVVRPPQLLTELRLALDAHLQRLPLQLGEREHLPAHLEHRCLGAEREGLLGTRELQAETAQLRCVYANASSAFVVSRSKAWTETSRCSSFVFSSLVCDRPRRDWTKIITVGTPARATSAASWSGPDGSRCEEPATSRVDSSASSSSRSSNGIGSIDQTFSHSTSRPSSWANRRDAASALLSISASWTASRWRWSRRHSAVSTTEVTIPGFVTTLPMVQTAPLPIRLAISRISSSSFAAPASASRRWSIGVEPAWAAWPRNVIW